jgi:hypothetical protein
MLDLSRSNEMTMKYSRESLYFIIAVCTRSVIIILKEDPKQNSIPAVTSEVGGNQILLCVTHDTLERPLRRSPVKPNQLSRWCFVIPNHARNMDQETTLPHQT